MDGAAIAENRWYGFVFDPVHLEAGELYYLELTSRPGPGETAPQAWFNSMADHHPRGCWRKGGVAQKGDLYFGLVGHHRFHLTGAAAGPENGGS